MKRKILIILLSFVAVFSVIKIVQIQFIEPTNNMDKYIELKDTISKDVEAETQYEIETNNSKIEKSGTKLNWEKLKSINPDIVGWITIPDTKYIDYPVLWNKTDNEDNQKYLYLDFKRVYTNYGSIFIDYRCKKSIDSENVILHGHSMNDGSMFGELLKYNDLTYCQNHQLIYFETQQGKSAWIIFAVCKINVSNDNYLNYLVGDFTSNEEKLNYIYRIRENSIYDFNVCTNENDCLITLSTCSYERANNRTVIMARKLRGNEKNDTITDNVSFNNNRNELASSSLFDDETINSVGWYDGKITYK